MPQPSADRADLAQRLLRFDRERFLASLLAPASCRPALAALLAFNLEISRVRERVSEPLIGRIRLQWWREVIDEANGRNPARAHDVAAPLVEAIRRHALDTGPLHRLIDGRERDLDPAPFGALDDLEAYADLTSASLQLAVLQVLGVDHPAAREAARRVGIAWALVGLVRASPHLRAAGHAVIPPSFDRAGGPNGAIRMIAERAAAHLDAAASLRRTIPPGARPALLIGRLARFRLRQLAKCAYDPANPLVQAPDGLAVARLWAASLTGRV